MSTVSALIRNDDEFGFILSVERYKKRKHGWAEAGLAKSNPILVRLS